MPTTDQLEQLADARRAHLAARLAALTPPASATAPASRHGTDLGQAVVQTVFRHSPSGLALLGIGAALMALSSGNATRNQPDATRTPVTLSASTLRTSLEAGLDDLPPDARTRIIAARLKAIDAQEQLDRHTRRAARAQSGRPVLTGALVAVIGAVIGGLIPSRKDSVSHLAATRDRMLREAERLVQMERARTFPRTQPDTDLR